MPNMNAPWSVTAANLRSDAEVVVDASGTAVCWVPPGRPDAREIVRFIAEAPALSARVLELETERAEYLERLRLQAEAAKVRIDELTAHVRRLEKPHGVVPVVLDVSVRAKP
jgi:hypothetical protein